MFIFVLMRFIKQIFDFYIQASIHVSFTALALVFMTNHMFNQRFDLEVACFTFFGTLFGYNFVKYEVYFRQKLPLRKSLSPILILSLLAFIASGFSFFKLEKQTQIAALLFLGMTLLYTIPLFSSQTNMRNWSGIKIYIVALCWAGVTTLLPLLNAGMDFSQDLAIKFGQRFLLIIVLVLIFEIIDLKDDDPSLFTVPQRIGVRKTKWLGILLLIPFYVLEFFKTAVDDLQLMVNAILVIVTSAFLLFANENRSRYYTTFWVECIPMFWLALLFIFQRFI